MSLSCYKEGNIVLHDYRAIYVFIPKVACSSIKAFCLKLLDMPHTGSVNVHAINFPCVEKREIDVVYEQYFKFAFVRNPWDRLVSCFNNKIMADVNLNNHEFINGVFHKLVDYGVFHAGMPFDAFVKAVSDIPDSRANPHFRSQHTFITDESGKLIVDFVGRFESINKDFRYICEKLGVEGHRLPHLMQNFMPERSYDNFYTSATRQMVQERYKKDVELFGYSF